MARRRKRKPKIKPIQFKKFGGKMCERLPDKTLLDDLREGDYIIYWDNGSRVAKVKKNHKGYKHRWIKTYPSIWGEYVLTRSRKVKPEKIKSGWRVIDDKEDKGEGDARERV